MRCVSNFLVWCTSYLFSDVCRHSAAVAFPAVVIWYDVSLPAAAAFKPHPSFRKNEQEPWPTWTWRLLQMIFSRLRAPSQSVSRLNSCSAAVRLRFTWSRERVEYCIVWKRQKAPSLKSATPKDFNEGCRRLANVTANTMPGRAITSKLTQVNMFISHFVAFDAGRRSIISRERPVRVRVDHALLTTLNPWPHLKGSNRVRNKIRVE